MATVVAVNAPPGQPTQAVQTVQHVATGNMGIHEPGKRHASTFRGLGATQVTIGCLSIILGAVAIILYFTGRPLYGYRPYYYNPTVSYIGAGIWSGIFFVIAGSLGIESAKMPTYSKINASMAMSIVASIFAFVMLCIESSGSILTQVVGDRSYAVHVILAILGAVEMIIAICQSAFCCASTCCGSRYQPPQTTVMTTTTTSTNQPIMVQQPGYQQQYVAPAPGVYPAPQQQGYVQPQQGYVQPQHGYVQPQQGYAQPQHGYVQPQQGYAQPQQGFVQPQQGYAQPQPGHSQQSQTVYPPQDPGMVKQDLQQQGYTPQPADAPQAEPRAPPAYSAIDPSSTQEQYMV